jgi:Tat protein translocase TatB subunit
MFLAFLESIGTTELLVILVAALVLFGPRRLPQLSRQLGKSLGEFKRASEDFKRTWEKEVEMEKFEEEGRMAVAMLQDDHSILGDANKRREALDAATEDAAATSSTQDPVAFQPLQPTVARTSSTALAEEAAVTTETQPVPETSGKRDWL